MRFKEHLPVDETQPKVSHKKRKLRNKIVGITTAAVLATGATGYLVYKGIQALDENRRNSNIEFEDTSTLGKEPSSYSYTGWRVRYPDITEGAKYVISLQDLKSAEVSEDGSTMKISKDGQEIDTGIAATTYYHEKTGAETPKLYIDVEDPRGIRALREEKLLAEPGPDNNSPEVVLLERSDGYSQFAAVEEIKVYDKLFALIPVTPVK